MPTQSTITADGLMTQTTLPGQLAISLFSSAMPVYFASPLLTDPDVPSSALVETESIGIMSDTISLPDIYLNSFRYSCISFKCVRNYLLINFKF